jgi:hypothetical protein
MRSMARARRLAATTMLVVVLAGLPSPAAPARVTAAAARLDAGAAVSTAAILPGSVGRSSLDLDAAYRATLKLTWETRAIWVDSTATIRNTSGGPIDRLELNTLSARRDPPTSPARAYPLRRVAASPNGRVPIAARWHSTRRDVAHG